MVFYRVFLASVFFSAFISILNPARLSGLINKNASLFTTAISYSSLGSGFIRALNRGWVGQTPLTTTYIGAVVCIIAVALAAAAFCMSIGNNKMRRLSLSFSGGAALLGLAGTTTLLIAGVMFSNAPEPGRVEPMRPVGIMVFYAMFALMLALAVTIRIITPKPADDEKMEMAPKYKLLLMILPFIILVALFSYLPLAGWRYAFFNVGAGFVPEEFVGLKWITYLWSNAAMRANIVRVLTNTFAMSGLGMVFSWLPIVFAIFLSEVRSRKFKRGVQTITTLPNFISWVLVYAVAFAIFSTEGFYNWFLINSGIIEEGANRLMSGTNVWLRMWAWGTWKGLGWSAIIYIASLSGIDPQLYEAATVDGAGRFRRMWHISVPGLLPTFFVLLLLGIANILSNGMEQYFVFDNPNTRGQIEVLDLYVYNLGLKMGSTATLPVATAVGMLKSLVSVTLLFAANSASKYLRGETIV